MSKPHVFRGVWYGWVVAGAGALLAGVAMAGQFFVNVLFDAWVAEFGWGRGTIALSYSFFWLVLGFLSMPAGWLAERYGMRRVAVVGALSFATGTFLMGTMDRLWELYLYNGVLLGVVGAIFWGPLYPYVTRWSWQRMGLLVAIVTIGMVAGGAILPPIMRYLEGVLGWRNALFLVALVGGLLMLGAASLLRPPPAYPEAVPGPSRAGESAPAASALTAGSALRRHPGARAFWGLSAGHFLGCVAHAGILVHLISIATSRGIPGVAAASVLSVMLASSVIGRFVFPVGAGRLGPRGSLALIQGGQIVGVLMLLGANDLPRLYLFALVLGLFFGGEFPIFPVLTRLYYGAGPVEIIFGGVMAWAGVGMALGAWIMGALFDATGTYSWGILVGVAGGVIGLLAVLVLPGAVALEPDRPGVEETA